VRLAGFFNKNKLLCYWGHKPIRDIPNTRKNTNQ